MNTYNKLCAGLLATLALSLNSFGDNHSKPELSPLNVVGSNAEATSLSSGLKSSLALEDTPRSITVISEEQIEAQGLKSIGDIVDFTPGVINSQGEGHRDAIVIRGKRTTQDFFRDGVRDDVQYYRPLYNIEQVEVLRGSDALTSGFGGAHGMVNRVSKKGVIGESFSIATGSVDTFGETIFQLDNNYEIDEDKALRVNMFGDNLENHRDFYYGNSFGVNPTMKIQTQSGGMLDVSYEYLNQERFIDRGIPTGSTSTLTNYLTPIESLKDYVFADSTENYSTHEAHIFKAVYEHDLTDKLTGRFSASYSDHDKLYQCLYASAYDQVNEQATLQGYVDTTQRDTAIFSYEISGQYETGSIAHNILGGIEYTSLNNDNDRFYADWTDQRGTDTDLAYGSKDYSKATFDLARNMVSNHAGTLPDGNQTVNNYNTAPYDKYLGDMSVFSLYLLDEIALSESLDLILSLRLDDMDYDVAYRRGDQTSADDRSDSDETISPKVGLIYDLTDQASLYAVYSETFQQITGDQYANIKQDWYKDVDPITHETTELGFRFDINEGLILSTAYFDINSKTPNQVETGVYNISESEVSGFELQVLGALSNNWFVSAGYTSLDAEDSSGNPIQEAPENVFSLWNNILISDRISVNFGIIYQDSSIIDNDDDDPKPYLPDYTRVDVGATYALTDNTRLQVQIENLTDELYFPSSHDTHQATVGAPINATFGITSSF